MRTRSSELMDCDRALARVLLPIHTPHTNSQPLRNREAVFLGFVIRCRKIVKGGLKLDHWGGGKLDQMSLREMGISREGGVWSGGLRSALRTAVRPERKTPPSARDVVVI